MFNPVLSSRFLLPLSIPLQKTPALRAHPRPGLSLSAGPTRDLAAGRSPILVGRQNFAAVDSRPPAGSLQRCPRCGAFVPGVRMLDHALLHAGELVSEFELPSGEHILCLTTGNRALTSVLCPVDLYERRPPFTAY